MSGLHFYHPRLRSILAAGVAFSSIAVNSASHAAVVVSGQNGVVASIYANPFVGATNGVGPIGGGTVTPQFPVDRAVDRLDGSDFDSMGSIQSSTATKGFMEFTAASSFNIGTVIGDQWVGSGYGKDPENPTQPDPIAPNMAYDLKVGGTIVQSGPGLAGPLGTHPIQVTTLASPILAATQMRIELNLAENAGVRYGNFNEAILLPDSLARIAATPTASSGVASYIYDLSGAGVDDASGGWIGDPNSTFTLTFANATTVNALVIATWENLAFAPDFVIRDIDTNLIIAHITMDPKDYGVIRLDTPVTTSALRFEFTGASALREVIALTAIPEPASALTLAAGGLLMLRRQRRVGL